MLRKKYPFNASPLKRYSSTWTSLCKAKSICDRGMRWLIRNKALINLWHNIIHGPFNQIDAALTIREAWDHDRNWALDNISFVLPYNVLQTINATPKPFYSDQDDLPTWNFHRMACSTLALHMHSPNIPLQPPSPCHGIGFGKSLPFLRSKPSYGWPVMKNFPPKPFFIIDRFFRTIPALSTTLTPKLPYTSLETALTLCPFGPTLPTLPSPTTLIATLLLTG